MSPADSEEPLTPLEEYLFFEDRQAYPWSFFVRLGFAGRADREACQAALRASVARHPLLSSVVHRRSSGALTWRRVENPMPAVRWSAQAAPETYPPATRLDVMQEIGVRLHGAVGPDQTRLILQFHHACCDGRGALAFIEDLLAEYARATGSAIESQERNTVFAKSEPGRVGPEKPGRHAPAPKNEQDIVSLRRNKRLTRMAGFHNGRQGPAPRGPRAPGLGRPVAALRARLVGLGRACRFLAQSPDPLVDYRPARDDDPTPEGFPAARSFRFDEATTSAIRSAAGELGVTVNDLLCRDLFLAVSRFHREARPGGRDACVRILVPVDLRARGQRDMPVKNQVGLVFFTRRAAACNDPVALLRGLHREMRRVKTWGLGNTFLWSLKVRKHLPGGLARAVRSAQCRATAALTNIGEVFRESSLPRRGARLLAGGLVLDAVDFLAPIRPLTCASLAVCTYAGRLSVGLQHDPLALSETAADRLFDGFLSQVQSSLPEVGRER